jgi:hypothetical protein
VPLRKCAHDSDQQALSSLIVVPVCEVPVVRFRLSAKPSHDMCTLKSIRRAEAFRAIVVELESEPAGTVGAPPGCDGIQFRQRSVALHGASTRSNETRHAATLTFGDSGEVH